MCYIDKCYKIFIMMDNFTKYSSALAVYQLITLGTQQVRDSLTGQEEMTNAANALSMKGGGLQINLRNIQEELNSLEKTQLTPTQQEQLEKDLDFLNTHPELIPETRNNQTDPLLITSQH